jgi:hypothetical protein
MKHNTIIILALLLSACETPYRKADFWAGGYSDQMVSDNVAIIEFNSNVFSSPTETEKLAMRRAAELTIERGFDGFAIEDGSNYETVNTSYTPGQTTTHCYNNDAFGHSSTCKSSTTSGFTTTTREPRTKLKIRMFKGPIPLRTGWYDARQVLKHVVDSKKPSS